MRTEGRLLRGDPVPAAVLVGMPVILMTLLSSALAATLAAEGYPGAPGSAQTVPGMACVFASFAVGIVGFGIFREHGWRTWSRLRAAGMGGRDLIVGKLAVPAGLLAAQHVVLFGFGVLFLDFAVSGSWLAIVLIAVAFGVMILLAGLAAVALLATVQQVNAVTNLGAMVAGGLGGGFVPVDALPEWVQPIAPISPVYWAMEGYNDAILEGGGVSDVLGPVGVLLGFAVVFGGLALWRLRLDVPKRTWG
ncbi:MAG: ABC transporter permease [Solirubrobacteraceae bacterium]|nr:ABC transporter permease [Solirubrobacteraceae bacterium]